MAALPRVYQKQFGVDGTSGYFGQFGSKAAASPTNTKDPTAMQSLAAFTNGLQSAVLAGNIPCLEDMNSLFFLAFRQLAYIFEQGVADYDATTEYNTGGLVKVGAALYRSIADTNAGNTPASSPTKWELYFDPSAFVKTTTAQNVDGVKTFGSFPVSPSSAPTTDYQLSNKKYVDDQVATKKLGSWASRSTSTNYYADTDGFVCASVGAGVRAEVRGYSDATSSPSTLIAINRTDTANNEYAFISFPVKKGDFWRVTNNSESPDGYENIRWIPFGV